LDAVEEDVEESDAMEEDSAEEDREEKDKQQEENKEDKEQVELLPEHDLCRSARLQMQTTNLPHLMSLQPKLKSNLVAMQASQNH
jgi:hypothetical protein